ncbi:CHASE2 domain-containing protein [Pseudomonas alkylphenolica]|uniref:CHASE2 domain-containing protein n=1 Tax=Pseudomonas alkylphenolica TaxID=237609 RepID=UPI0018D5B335|nr:CHASE2 domain-containing protein [Pseudomonas alkylphenolica]MBH3430444.1 CHASE2 domain-containing protein [Pseudomonas alkylphenolica]
MSDSHNNAGNEPIKGLEDYVAILKGYWQRPNSILEHAKHAWCSRQQRVQHYFSGFKKTSPKAIGRKLFECKTLSRAPIIFIAWFFTVFMLDKLDPFGLSHQVQAYSEGLFQKVTSSFYEPSAQDRIAVVLIDEQTLASRGESWPPRYNYYSEVIRRIARQEPSAIFLDFLVEDRRSYDDSLEAARESIGATLTKTGVPLYLATLDDKRNSVFIDVPGTQTTVTGWRAYGDDYPLLIGPGHFYGDSEQDLKEGEQCDSSLKPSAAFQLYRQLCEKGLQSGCPTELMQGNVEGFCSAMVVQWGRNVSKVVPERQLISDSQCSAKDYTLWERITDALTSGVAALTSGLDDSSMKRIRQRCPYAVTVREEDLASEKARGVLKGRVVMIGVSLNGIHDIVESPVHGQIPGVYLHAMALDNLLKWNGDYFKRAEGSIDWTLLVTALLLSWICAALMRAQPTRLEFLMRTVALSCVLLVSVINLYLHKPPLDWLGILLVYELVNRLIEKQQETELPAPTQGGHHRELDQAHQP